jgi:hypothetical protein
MYMEQDIGFGGGGGRRMGAPAMKSKKKMMAVKGHPGGGSKSRDGASITEFQNFLKTSPY